MSEVAALRAEVARLRKALAILHKVALGLGDAKFAAVVEDVIREAQ